MTLATSLLLLSFLAVLQDTPTPAPSDAAFRDALQDGGYNWYDSPTDSFRGLRQLPDVEFEPDVPDLSWMEWSFQALGRAIILLCFLALLAAIVYFIARFWERRSDFLGEAARSPIGRTVLRSGSLPVGLELDTSDPWAAALEARRAGDLRRAVVLLFAHLLIELEHHGLLRLLPGRTGRQLVRSVSDADLRRLVEPTLRLFEVVYYGHRAPDPDRFDEAWSSAEAFRASLAGRAPA